MKLELTEDRALVLYEWLHRLDENDAFPVEDESEQYVLWSLAGKLESVLSQPFRRDYLELVAQARARVRATQSAG